MATPEDITVRADYEYIVRHEQVWRTEIGPKADQINALVNDLQWRYAPITQISGPYLPRLMDVAPPPRVADLPALGEEPGPPAPPLGPEPPPPTPIPEDLFSLPRRPRPGPPLLGPDPQPSTRTLDDLLSLPHQPRTGPPLLGPDTPPPPRPPLPPRLLTEEDKHNMRLAAATPVGEVLQEFTSVHWLAYRRVDQASRDASRVCFGIGERLAIIAAAFRDRTSVYHDALQATGGIR